jgi:signal peptidase I
MSVPVGWGLGAAAAAAALAVAALAVLRRSFAVVRVNGPSMLPTLADRDRVLVRRVPPGRVRRGDVVVVEHANAAAGSGAAAAAVAEVPGRDWMVKRAVAVAGDPVPPGARGVLLPGEVVPAGRLVVLGDNAGESFDSRHCGYVPVEHLLGIVRRRLR